MFDLVDELLFPPDQWSLTPGLDPSFALQFDGLATSPLRVVTRGQARFLNYREEEVPVPVIEDAPLTTRILRSPLVTGFEEDKSSKLATQAAPRHWSAAIYTAEGELLSEFTDLSARFNGPYSNGYNRFTNLSHADPARVSKARRSEGSHVYMGFMRAHFGHFLLESLARAWAVVNLDSTVKLLFHPTGPNQRRFPAFAREILAAIDVDPARIIVVHEDLVPEHLIVPTSQFWIDWKGSPGMCIAFDQVRERLARLPGAKSLPPRVYLTRRLMEAPLTQRAASFAHNPKRQNFIVGKTLVNEDEVEALFAARGFEIIAPETRSLRDQVALASNASAIAGVTGSALHLAMFNDNPETKLIALDLRTSLNQLILEQIRGTRAFHIKCVGARDAEGRPQLDCAVIWQGLNDIL